MENRIRVRCMRCAGFSLSRHISSLSAETSSSGVVFKESAIFGEPFNESKPDQRCTLVERVLTSNQFKASLRLREFLRYVANCAVNQAPEAATEQQIGVHVFNRVPGYNSSEDSIVRTHARLLRQKLAEYFSNEGCGEPIIIEVPKGHYLPIFRPRDSEPSPTPFPVPAEVPPAQSAVVAGRESLWNTMPLGIFLGILFVVILACSAFLIPRAWPKAPSERTAIEAFWAPFLTGDPPVVIYSNTRFLGD